MKELQTASWEDEKFNEFGFWSANLDSGALDLCEIARRILCLQNDGNVKVAAGFNRLCAKDRKGILRQIKNASPAISLFQYILTGNSNHPGSIILKGHFKFNEQGRPTILSGIVTERMLPVAKESLKNDLLAMISHELKAPLTTIKLYIQLAVKTSGKMRNEPLSRHLNAAVREVDLMDNLMENFLDFSSISSGKIPLYPRKFDLAGILQEEFLRQREINHTHDFELSELKETMVLADRTKIRLVINNLINNAVKYAPSRSLIRLSCSSINDSAVVCVEDEGPGIAFEDQQKLFSKFSRVGGQEQTSKSGHGVGLYLVRKIMQAHNGETWVKSQPGKGSAFYFCLPEVNHERTITPQSTILPANEI